MKICKTSKRGDQNKTQCRVPKIKKIKKLLHPPRTQLSPVPSSMQKVLHILRKMQKYPKKRSQPLFQGQKGWKYAKKSDGGEQKPPTAGFPRSCAKKVRNPMPIKSQVKEKSITPPPHPLHSTHSHSPQPPPSSSPSLSPSPHSSPSSPHP